MCNVDGVKCECFCGAKPTLKLEAGKVYNQKDGVRVHLIGIHPLRKVWIGVYLDGQFIGFAAERNLDGSAFTRNASHLDLVSEYKEPRYGYIKIKVNLDTGEVVPE